MGRSKFAQIIVAASIGLTLQFLAQPVRAQQDISGDLSRAESLYYAADFQSALDLLLILDKRIGNDAGRNNERLRIHLFTGLAYLALNLDENAKSKMLEVCTLNPSYALNERDFPPKAIALFRDAKETCAQNQFCADICVEANRLIGEGKLDAAEARLKSAVKRCSCADAAAAAINDKRFLQGKQLYDRGEFAEAAKVLTAVLDSDGTHELAREYLGLSRKRIELRAELAFAQWRESFDSGRFAEAAAAYEIIRSSSSEPAAKLLAGQVESEYRKVLSDAVASWKTACDAVDRPRMDELRQKAANVASGMELGNTALLEMDQCNALPCILGDPALALRRLRTRVNPQIDASRRRYLSLTHVDIAIDEDGAVTVKNISNADAGLAGELRDAIEKWKFYPAVIDNKRRCVQTQLPISLILP